MEPVFETKRMRVYQLPRVSPTDGCEPVDIYVALRSDDDHHAVVATATLWERAEKREITWLEVRYESRRRGYGTELYDGLIEQVDNVLQAMPGTQDGNAFLKAMAARQQGS